MFKTKLSHFVLPLMATLTLHAEPFINDPFGDDIFKQMHQMQEHMDKAFEQMHQRMVQHTTASTPSSQIFLSSGVDTIFEDKGKYYLYNTYIKENKNNQIEVKIENNILYLHATTHTSSSSSTTQSSSTSMVQKSHAIPKDAIAQSLKGAYENGLFVLTLDKKEPQAKVTLSVPKPKPIKETNTTK